MVGPSSARWGVPLAAGGSARIAHGARVGGRAGPLNRRHLEDTRLNWLTATAPLPVRRRVGALVRSTMTFGSTDPAALVAHIVACCSWPEWYGVATASEVTAHGAEASREAHRRCAASGISGKDLAVVSGPALDPVRVMRQPAGYPSGRGW